MARVTVHKTKDLDLIALLDEEIFPGEACTDLRTNKARIWWVLKVEGEVAGYCGLTVVPSEDGPYGFLARAGVRAKYRGKGLQRRMIHVRDQEARRRGLPIVYTYTADWNVRSANNLILCGYKLYMPESKYAGIPAVYFCKRFKYRSA